MSFFERTLNELGLKRGRAGGGSPAADRRDEIARVTGLPVTRPELYERALRHASLVRHSQEESLKSNERLEFLGDAVLGLAAAEYLFEQFPDKKEGFLTKVRAKLVNTKALARYAETIQIRPLVEMSEDMDRTGGRLNPSVLANAFEALLGAIYLDHGYEPARDFVVATVDGTFNLEELVRKRENYKSLLLEFAQARGWPQPQYRVLSEEGPGHRRTFLVEVVIGKDSYGSGRGRNKKDAEQRAARSALKYLSEDDSDNPEGKGVALTG